MTCVRMSDGRCSLGFFGGSPRLDDCAVCTDYEGPCRGLGDRVADAMRSAGVARIVGKCKGCARRRAKLNESFPSKAAEEGV